MFKITAVGVILVLAVGCATTSPQALSVPSDPNAIIDISRVTVAPTPIDLVRPKYPFEMRRQGISGRALVYFVVRKDGKVTNARIESATDPLFGVAAKEAVEKWTYHPATINGRPVNCYMGVPISFDLWK